MESICNKILVLFTGVCLASCSVFSNEPDSLELANTEKVSMEKVAMVGSIEPNAARGENLWYMIGRRYNGNITMAELQKAELISDIISDYPNNSWTSGYGQVAIIASVSGKDIEAIGPNEILTAEQKSLLHSLRSNDGIRVEIDYKTQNIATKEYEDRQMTLSMGLLPDVQAEFPGGVEKLNRLLKEKSSDVLIDFMDKKVARDMEEPRSGNIGATVVFNLDEQGDAIDIKMDGSSGNIAVDAELMQLIDDMPHWIPAQNENGEKVKQQFEFRVGPDGC